MLRIPNRQNLLPPLQHTEFSVQKIPTQKQLQRISTFRAEFRRMCRILRLPAALVALIKKCPGRFLCSAVGTEFSLVHGTAGAGPPVCRFRRTTLRTELSVCPGSALCADPAAFRLHFRNRILRLLPGWLHGLCLLLSHSKQILRICASCCVHGHAHSHKSGHGTTAIGCRCLHGVNLAAYQACCCRVRIRSHCIFFPLRQFLSLIIRNA